MPRPSTGFAVLRLAVQSWCMAVLMDVQLLQPALVLEALGLNWIMVLDWIMVPAAAELFCC